MNIVPHSKVIFKEGFWKRYEKTIEEITVGSVYERLKETGRFDALKCDLKQMNCEPHIYWDSDIAKWIEGVAYLSEKNPQSKWERIADEAIDLIEKNQKSNGYFNSYYITMEPDVEFKLRENHELYCAGHLIESAIAYDRATGKHKFLYCMKKYADHIYDVFYVKKSAGFLTPGHEEIELALLQLFEYTGDTKYKELAKYFLNQRALDPVSDSVVESAELGLKYNQSDKPIMEITQAVGHAVRAGYLYTAMAALARLDSDSELLNVCKTVFTDIIDHKMSITGGIGACLFGEAFNDPYVLPNKTNYNETCAAISLAMFCHEMQKQETDSIYADVIERLWYNAIISGISLSGDAFFYENALEIDRNDYGHPYLDYDSMEAFEHHQYGLQDPRRLHRSKVFTCFCCPPNLVRSLASIGKYIYSVEGNKIYCNQFASSKTVIEINGKEACVEQKTNYPTDGKIEFVYHGEPATLNVRIPNWCIEYNETTKNGYKSFEVVNGTKVCIDLPMKIHLIQANPKVHDCAGKYAVMRGPLVYCMESIDNGEDLADVELIENGIIDEKFDEEYNAPIILCSARRRKKSKSLYSIKNDEYDYFVAKLIPYYAFANREICDMSIWIRIRESN